MKIPAQCLTVRHRAEAEHVSKDQIGKIFSIKAVGWRKSTPIVEFTPVKEVAEEAEIANSPSGLCTTVIKVHEEKYPTKLMEKKENGVYDPLALDSTLYNASLRSSNKSTNSDECTLTDPFHQQVVNTNASLGSPVPYRPSAQLSLVSNKSRDLDQKQKVHKELNDESKADTSPESILTVQPPSLPEIDSLSLDIGRIQKVYVIHYKSPASFYVTPSLEELQKFQK